MFYVWLAFTFLFIFSLALAAANFNDFLLGKTKFDTFLGVTLALWILAASYFGVTSLREAIDERIGDDNIVVKVGEGYECNGSSERVICTRD